MLCVGILKMFTILSFQTHMIFFLQQNTVGTRTKVDVKYILALSYCMASEDLYVVKNTASCDTTVDWVF